MLCFPCLIAGRNELALTVHGGNALCKVHVEQVVVALGLGSAGAPLPVPLPTQRPTSSPVGEASEHRECTVCESEGPVHYKEERHCVCGEALVDGRCESTFTDEDYAQYEA